MFSRLLDGAIEMHTVFIMIDTLYCEISDSLTNE